MNAELTTPRPGPPATLAEVRAWLGFAAGLTQDDSVLSDLLASESDRIQREAGVRMGVQRWALALDAAEFELRDQIRIRDALLPVQTFRGVTSYDADGTASTMSSSLYQVRTGLGARIALTDSGYWPTDLRTRDALVLDLEVGYPPVDGYHAPEAAAGCTLDDLTVAGAWSTASRARLEIEVDGGDPADPNTFKHRLVTIDELGAETEGAWTEDVTMAAGGNAVEGLTLTFGATTGHAAGDAWTLDLYRYRLGEDARKTLERLVAYMYSTKGSGLRELASGGVVGLPHDLRDSILALKPWNDPVV